MTATSEKFIFAVDVGNTRIKFGVFATTTSSVPTTELPASLATLAVPAGDQLDWARIATHFQKWIASAAEVYVAGPNPAGVASVVSGCSASGWSRPVVAESAADLPLKVNVDYPDRVGIDRLLIAVAGNVLRPPGVPMIVVGAGTATTVDRLTAEGAFDGGAIVPGLELGARALHQHTALLPLIDVQSLREETVPVLGRNTHDAVCSGLWFGHVGAIRELVSRLANSANAQPAVLITGGNGRWLAPALGSDFRYEPDLALRGLAYVAQCRISHPGRGGSD